MPEADQAKKEDRHGMPRGEGPRSAVRVMQILDRIASSGDGVSLAELSRSLGAPKTSLLALLRSLESSEYIQFHNGTYFLGMATVRLGLIISSGVYFPKSLRPIFHELLNASGETSLIALLARERPEAIYVDKAESSNPIRFAATIGSRRPLYCTAVGRVLLAFQDDGYVSSYLANEALVKHTPKTMVDRSEIKDELSRIRQSCVAVTMEQSMEGAAGFAAPIFSREGAVFGAVGVAAPIARVVLKEQKLMRLVRDAGSRMSWTLGYSGSYPVESDRETPSAAMRMDKQRKKTQDALGKTPRHRRE